MWFFRSPTVVFGEDALSHLGELRGRRAFIITDPTIRKLGLLGLVLIQLDHAGIHATVFEDVEPEPSLTTIRAAAAQAARVDPDWIIGVGGGSAMDAAKAVWILHENPGLDLEAVSPLDSINLRARSRLIAIPTTAGTGSEVTWATVLTTTDENGAPRKIGTGHPAAVPDLAIIDPVMSAGMPPSLTADTGMDALTQAIEGYVATWHNEFADGLCLVATKLAFAHLAAAYRDGRNITAREKMALSAAIGGLGYINSMVGLAHSMAHAAGALFHLAHGRACAVFLPICIEFSAERDRPPEVSTRYADIVHFLGWQAQDEHHAASLLADRVRDLRRELNLPATLSEAGVRRLDFERALDQLVDAAMSDTVIFTAPRQPTADELRALFVRSFA